VSLIVMFFDVYVLVSIRGVGLIGVKWALVSA
jgi:hypothetical protein